MARINNPDYSRAKSIHEFTVRNLIGEPELIKLDKYKGLWCIIVNTDTNSGLTIENYKLFNELMDMFGDNLRILAFPCDQFGYESGSPEKIASDVEKHNVKIDLFAKVNVNGEQASDLWNYLKHTLKGQQRMGDMIKTSYTKFIVNRAGIPVERFGPEVGLAQFQDFLRPFF